MCGRYAASVQTDRLIEIFGTEGGPRRDPEPEATGPTDWTRSRWNIAPTDVVPSILERQRDGQVVRRLEGLRWGLVPSWSTSAATGARMINARLETVTTKPSFKRAFAARRCLLPADGYYEWYPATAAGRAYKQPFYIHPHEGLMAMAGIYEFWRDPRHGPDDGWLVSCAIITTAASDDLGRIHDRMPVQVAPDDWDAWLDPALTDSGKARQLVHVPLPGEMTAHAVSTRVNRVGNDGPDLVVPIAEAS
ncbi:SOS response-associated peptidase [Brooklawnia cerclae]|uniref:Abasic site processing protein n=1 Tax=Brooklawnia cerclae TaxID=349934 RepID=A0ABX0SI23_9ACTN|nr:SOS response-associated peptidase [Brooklawnia cerclae]NIH56406.1 putative SOS response-associated peptidase YedK [Brooklawnia cerclae]